MTSKTKRTASIVYPESDGMPLPDGGFQAPIFLEIVSTLRTYFRNRPNCQVNGNTFIYYEEGNPQRRVAPDCFVAFDVDLQVLERDNTYLLWEVGKAPDFVLEIASPSTARTDVGAKRRLYAYMGMGEYWRFDSTGGDFYGEALVGEVLVDGEYQRLPLNEEGEGVVRGHSDALGLDMVWEDGRLRFYDLEAGRWLLNQTEEQDARYAAETAQQTAETARMAAEIARQDAEARAAELEAELQRMRGESR